MFVYKISENINNFYYLLLSRLKDGDIILDQFEHANANDPESPMSRYLFDKYDDLTIEKTDIKPKDFLDMLDKTGSYYESIKNDNKCINVSNEFEKHIVEKKKKGKKETTEPKPAKEPKPKKEAKHKAPKSSGIVKIEGSQVLNFSE